MRTIIILLLMLPLGLTAKESWAEQRDRTWRERDEKIKALWEAYKVKYVKKIQEAGSPGQGVSGCYKPGQSVERDDPPYLAWREARRREAVADDFYMASKRKVRIRMDPEKGSVRVGSGWDGLPRGDWDYELVEHKADFPELWDNLVGKPDVSSGFSRVTSQYIYQWARENIERKPEGADWPTTFEDPPPLTWTWSGNVDSGGRAVDAKGHIDMQDIGPNWPLYFWFPMLLGILAGLFAMSKGAGPKMTGLSFVGAIVVYGYLTNPDEVFACFFGVYLFLVILAVAIIKTVTSGLGNLFGSNK